MLRVAVFSVSKWRRHAQTVHFALSLAEYIKHVFAAPSLFTATNAWWRGTSKKNRRKEEVGKGGGGEAVAVAAAAAAEEEEEGGGGGGGGGGEEEEEKEIRHEHFIRLYYHRFGHLFFDCMIYNNVNQYI